MIKAVLFDIGGVLLTHPVRYILLYAAAELQVSLEDMGRVIKKYKSELKKGIISEQEYWRRVCFDLHVPPPTTSLWYEGMKKCYKENEEVMELARSVQKHYKTAIISNTEIPVINLCNKKGLFRGFDAYVFSFDCGMVKPNPQIYLLAAKSIGVEPHEAVFIDDVGWMVQGAQAVGMNALLFKNIDYLKRDLQRLLR